LGVKKGEDDDVLAKDRLKQLKEAAENVKKMAAAYVKSALEYSTHSLQLHESLEALYPLEESFAGNLEHLLSESHAWRKSKEQLEQARADIDGAVAAVLEKERSLLKMVEEREKIRVDVHHYTEKLDSLRAKPAANPKEQARVDENAEKLSQSQTKLTDIDARLAAEMKRLSADVASLTTLAFRVVSFPHAHAAACTLCRCPSYQ
jgi:chromosome segregation ATPase